MASRRQQIVDAMVTALSAAGGPTGLTVLRTHPAAIDTRTLPAAVVRRVEETVVLNAGGYKARRSLLTRVDCFVGVSTPGVAAETALDALTSWVVQQVMGLTSLQGGTGCLAHQTHEVLTKWEETDSDAVYARAAVGFSSDYITAAGNPDAA